MILKYNKKKEGAKASNKGDQPGYSSWHHQPRRRSLHQLVTRGHHLLLMSH